MSFWSFLNKKTDTVGYGIGCIVISAILSFIVSIVTVNNSASKELKSSLFKDEIPVMNRVSTLWSECYLYNVVTIGEHHIMETQPILYIDNNGQVVKRDTLKTEKIKNDTTSVHIPSFAYKRDSYEMFIESLDYIRRNLDNLSPQTYASVVEMLSFIDDNPIIWIDNEAERIDSPWTKQEVYSGFFDRLGSIYAAYLKKQRKFL